MVKFLETLCSSKQNYKEIENNIALYVVSSIILQLRETKVSGEMAGSRAGTWNMQDEYIRT